MAIPHPCHPERIGTFACGHANRPEGSLVCAEQGSLAALGMTKCGRRNLVPLLFPYLKALLFVTAPSADLHDQLAEVLALQQAEECLRRLAEPVDHGLAALELAGLHEPAD